MVKWKQDFLKNRFQSSRSFLPGCFLGNVSLCIAIITFLQIKFDLNNQLISYLYLSHKKKNMRRRKLLQEKLRNSRRHKPEPIHHQRTTILIINADEPDENKREVDVTHKMSEMNMDIDNSSSQGKNHATQIIYWLQINYSHVLCLGHQKYERFP